MEDACHYLICNFLFVFAVLNPELLSWLLYPVADILLP